MTATVQLASESHSNELLVPLSAVLDTGKGPFVRIVEHGKVTSRPVNVSRFLEEGATITSGLQAGEPVIVVGAAKLVDGNEVQPRSTTPPARQR
jgi:multidrug efflux pump subunit AcrA (membrane-fusion protein)